MKRFKQGGPRKLQSAKNLEGTSLFNACSRKRKRVGKNTFLNIGCMLGSMQFQFSGREQM